MGNRIKRTVLFAAFALLSISAFGAGAARLGTLRNADWVVTNAWQAVSNKTHDLILEIGHGDSWTGIVDRALSYGTETYWTDATGIVWEVVGSTTNIVGRVALTNDIPDSVSADLTDATNYTNQVAEEFENGDRSAEWANNAGFANNADLAEIAKYLGDGPSDEHAMSRSDLILASTNAAVAVADEKISTNNAAFVSAVLAAPLVGADASDLSELSEYGSYGTVGAALLALIAGLAALKRGKLDGAAAYPAWVQGDDYEPPYIVSHKGRLWSCQNYTISEPGEEPRSDWVEVTIENLKQNALTGAQMEAVNSGATVAKVTVWDGYAAQIADKMPQYSMVTVAPSGGTLTVAPYTVATYTADSSAEAFTVAVGTGTAGRARDCELVIDCTATEVAPTVTWPATFHPRTDAGTDFACEVGVRNVYFISEYATGEFAVGGWQETTGGNA